MDDPSEPRSWRSLLRHPHTAWILWFVGLIVLGPCAWVLVYDFMDPPLSLAMALESDRPVERSWLPLAKISPNLIDAAIAGEDPAFCRHHGYDSDAAGQSWRGTQPGRPIWGSDTITRQTVRQLFLWPDRTWLRQALESYFTALVEISWPKRRIIEVYLNIAEWGDGVYGIQAAARHYFRTDAGRLTSAQAARLVAILPNPRRWTPLSDAPLIYYRASTIQERGDLVRVDGGDACIAEPR